MKTRVAVYEEGLFDLRGGKTFKGGKCPLSPPSPKRNPAYVVWYWRTVPNSYLRTKDGEYVSHKFGV